ncbi:hypothetical protein [Parasutterella excrementihominis]|uniref:MuF-C-terminal domain-containing protein n=1 Tax=Parasutterella excrementihominis TaxID=487175 RepID=UPI00248AF717|nr:hypothetical protein [Parasutterella excrementihominis]
MNWLNAFGETVQTQPEALRGFGVAKDMEPTKPSAFQGTGEALEKALPFSFYQSLSGVNELMADRVEVNYDLDNNEDAFSDFKPTQEQKEQVADRLRQDAKFARLKAQNDYTPNPETTGQAAMMIHGLTGSLAKAIGYTVATGGSGILAAPLFGADLGLYEAGKLRDKGVDASTARTAGAITGTVNAVGMALPGAVGTSYVKSMLFGGAVNPLTDISEQASIKFVLDNANYSKQAQEYDPFDPVNLGVSAGMGIAFGAFGARANRAQARYEAAEAAAQPIAPQTPEGQATPAANMNKSVLDSIQNRDRSSKESRLQMEKIAAAPNFNLLRESRSLDQGAPIIAYVPDDMNILWGKRVDVSADPSSEPMTMRYAVVDADDVLTSNAVDGSSNPGFTDPTVAGARAIAGNGRIAGLQGAYRQVKATKYRADLTQDSKEFGISKRQIKKMRNPILVRVMDDADVVEGIGEASNRTGTLKLNPAEQAAQDARNVRLEEVEFTKDGEITRKSMDEFVKRTPDKEGLIDSNGNALYDNIARRMRPAIFAAAFSDTRIINRFIADSPEDRKIMNVLQSVATEVVRLKKIKGELDFSPDLLEAVADVFETRREAKKINGKGHEQELTGSLMEESATPAQRYFRDILLSANPERLQEILARFREVAEQESGGAGFFEAVTKDQVFETVKSEFDQREAAINAIKPSDVDAAMELNSANVIQNDQPVGTRGDVNRSIADEKKAAEQIDNGERVEVSGEGVDPEVMDKEVSDFITRFVKELVGAGAEKKVAEMGAKVLDAFYQTLGIRLGKSRKELEQEYALRVQRGEKIDTHEGFASMSPQERLDTLNRSREFDEQLKLWEQGKGTNKFNLGRPSWVLQIFGASDRKGINTTKRQFIHVLLPKGKKLLGMDGKHGLKASELKGLLVGIQHPIAVFKSDTDGGIVLITELKRGDSPIIVPIHLTRNKDGDFQIINFVASTYEKERSSINKWVEKGLLLGYDKTKGPNVLPRDFGSNSHLSRSANVTKTSANDKTLNPSVRPIIYQNETSIGDMYQNAGILRGIYTPGERVITLMQSANESTFIHESGHYFLDVLTDVAMKENAPAQVKADVQTLMDWFGVKDLEEWRSLSIDEQRAAHEQFARGFEQYLREGEAPSTALEKVFKAFKDWLTKIYKSSEELQVEISPEVRAVYDRLLATDEQIRAKEEIDTPSLFGGMEPEEPPANPVVKAVQQTAEQVIDQAPISEDSKARIRETLGINQPEPQTGENHPHYGIPNEETFMDQNLETSAANDPNAFIVLDDGREVSMGDYMREIEAEQKQEFDRANSVSEAAQCMLRNGAFDDVF